MRLSTFTAVLFCDAANEVVVKGADADVAVDADAVDVDAVGAGDGPCVVVVVVKPSKILPLIIAPEPIPEPFV
jgi:hypothetical protein